MDNTKCQNLSKSEFQAANLLNLQKAEKPTSCQKQSLRRCSAKRVFQKFPKIHRVLLECYNTCATESHFNNVTGLHTNSLATLLKGTPALVFTSEFCENFENNFSQNTFGRLFIPCICYRISVSIYDKKLLPVLFKQFLQEREVGIGRCSFNQNP